MEFLRDFNSPWTNRNDLACNVNNTGYTSADYFGVMWNSGGRNLNSPFTGSFDGGWNVYLDGYVGSNYSVWWNSGGTLHQENKNHSPHVNSVFTACCMDPDGDVDFSNVYWDSCGALRSSDLVLMFIMVRGKCTQMATSVGIRMMNIPTGGFK